MVRVLQVTPVFGSIGGLENFIARLSEQLCDHGHPTLVVADDLIPGPERRYETRSLPGLADLNAPCSAAVEAALLRYAAEFAPDVILIHSAAPRILHALSRSYPTACLVHSFLCAGSKLLRRSDRVCTHPIGPRCLIDWYAGPCGPNRSLQSAWQSYRRSQALAGALQQARAVLVASEFMRDYLATEGLQKERIRVVAGLNVGVPMAGADRPAAEPPYTVLFVGRVVYNKGIQYAVQALTHLGDSYRLVVVGDGWYLPRLKALTDQLGLSSRVTFTGFLEGEALQAQYRQASVAVVPSLLPEPAGLVVPEARGQGLPVAAFDVGGIGEWTATYDKIYLAAPADVAALAGAIEAAATGKPAAGRHPARVPREPLEQILIEIASEAAPQLSLYGLKQVEA